MSKAIRTILAFVCLLYAQNVSAQITWTNDRTGEKGTATGLPDWTINNVNLGVGINPITVTYTNVNGTATDQITITYTPTHPGPALVGAWGFEEGGGLTTADSSGNNNNGTLTNGPTWAINGGKFGNAITFDGVNDFVNVLRSNSLDLTQSFTISAWVFPTAVRQDWSAVVVKNYTQYLYATTGGLGVSCKAGAVLAGASVSDGTLNGTSINVCDNTAIPQGQWSHLAVTYDAATGNLLLYINGGTPTTIAASGLMPPSTGDLQIGASQFAGEYFAGKIDEVRIYNVAIQRTAGTNKTPNLACGDADYTALTRTTPGLASVIGDMNCPVIVPAAISAPSLKIGSSSTFKVGSAGTVKVGAAQ